jgi:hypothetical protein
VREIPSQVETSKRISLLANGAHRYASPRCPLPR